MAESFHFSEWIDDNNLHEIQDLLSKHDMNCLQNLSTQSKQFAMFMSDPTLLSSFPHLIKSVIEAIQKVRSFAVISQKEEDIIIALESNLKSWTKQQEIYRKLKQDFAESVRNFRDRKTKKIKNLQNTINDSFLEMAKDLHSRKQESLKKVMEFAEEYTINDKTETSLELSYECIELNRQNVSKTLEKCNQIIQSSFNLNRDERQKQIIDVYAQHMNEMKDDIKTFESKTAEIVTEIQKYDSTKFHIHFVDDEENLIKLMQRYANLAKSDVDACVIPGALNEKKIRSHRINEEETTITYLRQKLANLSEVHAKNEQYIRTMARQEDKIHELNLEVKRLQKIANGKGAKNRPKVLSTEGTSMKFYAMQSLGRNDISFLDDYAMEKGIEKPRFVCERKKGVWIATLQLNGRVIIRKDKTKKKARLACAEYFAQHCL